MRLNKSDRKHLHTSVHCLPVNASNLLRGPTVCYCRQGGPRNRTCVRVCRHAPRLRSLHRAAGYRSAVGANQTATHLQHETDDVLMASRLARSMAINPRGLHGVVVITRIVTQIQSYFGISSLRSLSPRSWRMYFPSPSSKEL
ncbi:unnamed protein product [Ectocarpus fasciculatus]